MMPQSAGVVTPQSNAPVADSNLIFANAGDAEKPRADHAVPPLQINRQNRKMRSRP
jgi:hypothetical protein